VYLFGAFFERRRRPTREGFGNKSSLISKLMRTQAGRQTGRQIGRQADRQAADRQA
jgi:hypothetical protein